MPISIFTGPPGAGKTTTLVHEITTDKIYQGRDVYAHAIEETEEWAIQIRCKNQACRRCRKLEGEQLNWLAIEDWPDWAAPGSIIIADEAHYCFPQRREGKPPFHVERLTESRHDGVDFFLITQLPMMLDKVARGLAERHDHFMVTPTGRWRVSHPVVQEDVADCIKSKTKERIVLPKSAWKKFKSADMHTVQKRKLPRLFWYGVGSVPVFLLLLWYSYNQIFKMRSESVYMGREEVAETQEQSGIINNIRAASSNFTSRSEALSYTAEQVWSLDFQPRIENKPESAPAYDRTPPEVIPPDQAACIKKVETGACTCYTSSGQRYQTSRQSCSAFVEARYYNPYRPTVRPDPPYPTTAQPAPSRLRAEESAAPPGGGSILD